MKGVPIKFRGKCKEYPKRDKFVYGGFYQSCDDWRFRIIDDTDAGWVIDRDSVAQLIGYDDEGNEVYEGDMIDAYIDGKIAYTFQAVLLNNFFVPKNMPNLKHIVRKESGVQD